jgi:ribose transport system substrate-binding protein
MAFTGTRSRSSVGLALLGVAVLVTAGAAGRPAAQRTAHTHDQEAFTPQRAGGIPGALLPEELKLWQYDPAPAPAVGATRPRPTCQLAGAAGRHQGRFAEGRRLILFSFSINKHLYELAWSWASRSSTAPEFDAEKAAPCAERIVSPGTASSSTPMASVATAVAGIYDAAGCPRCPSTSSTPTVFSGADNYTWLHRRPAAGQKAPIRASARHPSCWARTR